MLLILGIATLSVLTFVAILWGMRRMTAPPQPGDEAWPAWRNAAIARVAEAEALGVPLAIDEAARRLRSHQLDLGTELVAVRGPVGELVQDGSRLRVLLVGAGDAKLPCWLEDATATSLGLAPGDVLHLSGLAADVAGRVGLHFCRLHR